MVCVIAFHSGDVAQAIDLLSWIKLLGGCKSHDCLLVADADTQWSDCIRAVELAKESFKGVELIATEKPLSGWPKASNEMFLLAASHLAVRGQPFFVCEPDCIPLKPGWLDALEDGYKKYGRLFMGAHVRSQPPLPAVSVAGCAVYPARAAELLAKCCQGPGAWDVECAAFTVPQSANTDLIQHFWGQKDLAPTFVQTKTPHSPKNAFTLQNIKPEAVVFHRNKDGSLIRLLKRQLKLGEIQRIRVVFAFCNRDAELAIKNLNWMLELEGCSENSVVLCADSDTLQKFLTQAQSLARSCFGNVDSTRYRCGSSVAWPQGANVAFRHSAYRMAEGNDSWLWLEPDAIPVKPGWLSALEDEYARAGQLFMGPIVPGMGHQNGVGIYPSDTPFLIPNALATNLPRHIAWDSAMKPEMIHLCHDAGHLIQHVWGIVDGNPNPRIGDSPVFDAVWKLSRWVLPSAVLFHRNKDGSLIDCIKKFRAMQTQ